MKKIALIAHTADRLDMLSALLTSIKSTGCLAGYRVCLVAQGYDAATAAQLKALPAVDVLSEAYITGARLGPHSARMLGLRRWPADLYVSLDDDMVLTERTSYQACEALVQQPGVGFAQARNATNRLFHDRFSQKASGLAPAKLVCTGGGLLFTQRIADVLLAMPDAQYLFDDVEWALQAILHGYVNWVDNSSWAIHSAGRAGGRNGWFAQKLRQLPDPTHIRVERDPSIKNKNLHEGNRVRFPADRDLTGAVRAEHESARLASGWPLIYRW